jgi:hypothetical protein
MFETLACHRQANVKSISKSEVDGLIKNTARFSVTSQNFLRDDQISSETFELWFFVIGDSFEI